MADPITGAAVGGVANAVGSKVIEKIVKGENDYEEWLQQVVDTATEAEAARRYCLESARNPERSDLEMLMAQFGKQGKKLEVIGERQGYNGNQVEIVGEFADTCSNYATAVKANNLDPEQELTEELPRLVEQLFSFAG